MPNLPAEGEDFEREQGVFVPSSNLAFARRVGCGDAVERAPETTSTTLFKTHDHGLFTLGASYELAYAAVIAESAEVAAEAGVADDFAALAVAGGDDSAEDDDDSSTMLVVVVALLVLVAIAAYCLLA